MTTQTGGESVIRDQAGIARGLSILKQRFGERYSDSAAVRDQHGHQTTWLPNQPPDAVVFPESTEETADIVRVCAQWSIPVIPFGVGTSLEGHVNAPFGGVSLDFVIIPLTYVVT